jgi:hypothetical protein
MLWCGFITSFEFLKLFLVVFQQLTEVELLPLCTGPLKCLSSRWSLLVTIYKKYDKTDFSNYHRIPFLQSTVGIAIGYGLDERGVEFEPW